MVEFKKLLGLRLKKSSRGLSNWFNKIISFIFFLFISTLCLNVTFCDKLYINVFRKPLLPFGIRAYTILNAHSINTMRKGRVNFSSEIFNFFNWFFLLLENFTNLIFDAVKRFIIIQSVLLQMGSMISNWRFGTIWQ